MIRNAIRNARRLRLARNSPYPTTVTRRSSGSSSGSLYRTVSRSVIAALGYGIGNSAGRAVNRIARSRGVSGGYRVTKPLPGRKRKRSTRKLRNPYAKPKKTKFAKKVNKVLDGSKPVGNGTITDYLQLRQTTVDRWSYYPNFASGNIMCAGSWLDINNFASIMFNSKTATSNILTTTNNFVNDTKLHVINYHWDFFFKSTSGHVVNIELYECTSKQNQNESAQDASGDGLVDLNNNISDFSGTGNATTYGMKEHFSPELLSLWKVKKHTWKLNPGDYCHFVANIAKNKTYVGSDMMDRGTPYLYPKGSKYFYFKVINDPTVGTATGHVHHWPSNEIGGVAMRCSKVCKIRCPDNTLETSIRNSLFVLNVNDNPALSGDQQVTLALSTAPIN